MKQNLLIILLLFVGSLVYAQMETDQETYTTTFSYEESEVETEIEFVAMEQGQEFIWKLENINAPAEWKIYVCDFNNCYTPSVTEITADNKCVLESNSSKVFSVHLRPNSVVGSGEYKLTYYDLDGNTLFSNTLIYNSTVVGTHQVNVESINIFPNPVTNVFKLDGDLSTVDRIDIFNLVGTRVESFYRGSREEYDVTSLNRGRYFVRLIDNDGQQVKVLRMLKK